MKKRYESITIKNVKTIKRIKLWLDRHPTGVDGIVTLILSGLAFLNLYINWGMESTVRAVFAIVLILLIIVPFTIRRRFPLIVLSISTVAILIYRTINIPESSFTLYALLLLFFSAGAYSNHPWRDWVRGISVGITIGFLTYSVFFMEGSGSFPVKTTLSQVSTVLSEAFLFGAAWWIGDVFRTRRQRELELQERTLQLEHERDENARRAVLDERVRIARELHDVVAHHVSVMGIQAGAARRILKQQPEKANEVLSQIEASSREAVTEMQRLTGFLRQQTQVDELAPQPSLKQLDVLINHMREAGLSVDVIIKGESGLLPPSVDLSAYRIVQESLTNTLKHAGPVKAKVIINYTRNSVELEIRDNGQSLPSVENSESRGRGIIGMRERAALHGGEFIAGKAPEGGFIVRAKLPFAGQVL